MQRIGEVVPSNGSRRQFARDAREISSEAGAQTATSKAAPTVSNDLVDYLWLRMGGLYGATWERDYGANPRSSAGREWGLTLAGMSRQQIDAGLEACRVEGSDFPPSAPRFRAMCLGVPSLGRVKFELSKHFKFRSAFTRAVWRYLDVYAYRAASARDAERMLRDAYDVAKEAVMRGEPLPHVVGELEAPKGRPHKPATREQMRKHLADISATLGLSPSEAESMGKDGLLRAGDSRGDSD